MQCIPFSPFPLPAQTSFLSFLSLLLSGCDKKSRGWSISMLTGNTWQDLLGCDFVLDLIGEMEEFSNLSSPSQSSAEYPIMPVTDRSFLQSSDLDL